MKKYRQLLLFVLPVIALGLFVTTGCGKEDDTLKPETIQALWEEQVLAIHANVTALEDETDDGKIAASINEFARQLEVLAPRINRTYERYAASTRGDKKPENPPVYAKERDEEMLKLTAVGLFTENLVQVHEAKFTEKANALEAVKRLDAIIKTIKLDEELKKHKETGPALARLVTGEMKGGTRVEPFFERMRLAAVTSRFKVTMRLMYILGKAVDAYKADHQMPPNVTDLKDLQNIKDFIPKYINKLPLEDAWGNYFYYRAVGKDYWIGSSGTAGMFHGYEQRGFYSDPTRRNIILSNGAFVYALRITKNEKK